MIYPASMNMGIANSEKEFIPVNTLCGIAIIGLKSVINRKNMLASMVQNAIGTPVNSNTIRKPNSMAPAYPAVTIAIPP
jgi:hypothetical protein